MRKHEQRERARQAGACSPQLRESKNEHDRNGGSREQGRERRRQHARARTFADLVKADLGKRAAQGLEAPSRMRCARMNGTCGAPCREGRPTRRGAPILNIYSIFPQIVTPSRTEVRFSLCTPRDRLLVKVPRCCAYPLRALGGRFISTVITSCSGVGIMESPS